MSDSICVLSWQEPGLREVSRGERLHLCEDAQLMADELNREWPNINHWAAPATSDELASHAARAARLMADEKRAKASLLAFSVLQI
jgi:hypothetical protein